MQKYTGGIPENGNTPLDGIYREMQMYKHLLINGQNIGTPFAILFLPPVAVADRMNKPFHPH